MDTEVLKRGVAHPQVHLDYYEWLKTMSESDKNYLTQRLSPVQLRDMGVWIWSKSRECLKRQAEESASEEK